MAKPTRVRYILDDRKLKEIMKEVQILNNSYTVVGLLEGEPPYPDGLTVADVGFFNEFGTKFIPERPWMRGWFDANKPRILKQMKILYQAVVDGRMKAKRALALLGEWVQAELRKSIIDLKSPPNALITILRKKSSNPLVDTGQMLNSVHHKEYYNVPAGKVKNL
jgi:hypothetical protein